MKKPISQIKKNKKTLKDLEDELVDKNAMLLSEDEGKSIEETLFLTSIPGYVEKLKKIKNNENWTKASEYQKDEKW